jgi:uncharacterized protein (DUF1015 family)
VPKIRPFTGIRYDISAAGPMDTLVAPPYDVITPELEGDLRGRSEYNIIRLDLPRDEPGMDRYTSAGALMARWLREGVLVHEPHPMLYVMNQTFMLDGTPQSITGVLAAVALEPLGRGILPHEETLIGPRADRLSLMRTTAANLSPIYGIYSDPAQEEMPVLSQIAGREPLVDVANDAGVRHRLWAASAEEETRAICDSIGRHDILIADGHHRYKTALTYQAERKRAESALLAGGDHPYDFTLMFLVNMDGGGLVTLPVHRLVRNIEPFEPSSLLGRLRPWFHIEMVEEESLADLLSTVEVGARSRSTFGLYVGAGHPFYVLRLRSTVDVDALVPDPHSREWKCLDVTILHRLVIERAIGVTRANVENQRDVAFRKDAAAAKQAVDSGDFQAALFMGATPVAAVEAIAGKGETMPQKSTYFYPKPLTGLVINPLE